MEALRELGAEVPDFEDMDPGTTAAGPRVRAAHHHHHRHPVGARPQARRLVRARQPDLSNRGSARSRRTSPRPPSAASTSSGSATPPAPRYRKTTCSPGAAEGHDHRALRRRIRPGRAVGRGVCGRGAGRPEDDGFFGPASVTWRVSADLSAPVAGLRSLLLQALHPLAMAGSTSTATGGRIRSAGSRPPRPTRSRSRSGTGPAPGGSRSGCGPSTPMSVAWTR